MTYMICVSFVGFACFFSYISLLHRNVAMKITVSSLQGYTICCTIDEIDEAVVVWFVFFFSWVATELFNLSDIQNQATSVKGLTGRSCSSKFIKSSHY